MFAEIELSIKSASAAIILKSALYVSKGLIKVHPKIYVRNDRSQDSHLIVMFRPPPQHRGTFEKLQKYTL